MKPDNLSPNKTTSFSGFNFGKDCQETKTISVSGFDFGKDCHETKTTSFSGFGSANFADRGLCMLCQSKRRDDAVTSIDTTTNILDASSSTTTTSNKNQKKVMRTPSNIESSSVSLFSTQRESIIISKGI